MVRSVPTPATEPATGYSVCACVPAGGQLAVSLHWSTARSTDTLGSFSIPFWMPSSHRSNQRCRVATQAARRKSNGSMCPVWDSHSLRGTDAGSASSHWPQFTGLTFRSARPLTENTAARTFAALRT